MREKIHCLFQAFWKWMRRTLADKCGELPLGNVKSGSDEAIKREIVISNTRIHIRSIFTGQTRLDEAMKKIITRKLPETKKST